MINNKSNAEILEEFDKLVVGHTQAKKMLINLVNRSKVSHYHKYLSYDNHTDEIETLSCLLIGASGTGKTFMVKTLQKLVDFPLVCIDATRLEPNGGGSKSTDAKFLLKMIVENAERLVAIPNNRYHSLEGTVDQTVVFIDEIDKLAKPFESSGNWNNQIQSGLLSVLEGSEGFEKVSFILAGAFSDLREEKSVRTSIGFHTSEVIEKEEVISDKAVIQYGLMPELVGRLHSIVLLDEMTYDVMDEILHTMLLPQRLAQLSLIGVDGEGAVSVSVQDTIIEEALTSGQGVRSLKRSLNLLFNELEFNYEENLGEEVKQLQLNLLD